MTDLALESASVWMLPRKWEKYFKIHKEVKDNICGLCIFLGPAYHFHFFPIRIHGKLSTRVSSGLWWRFLCRFSTWKILWLQPPWWTPQQWQCSLFSSLFWTFKKWGRLYSKMGNTATRYVWTWRKKEAKFWAYSVFLISVRLLDTWDVLGSEDI